MVRKKENKISYTEHLAIFIAVLSLALSFALTMVSRIGNLGLILDNLINLVLLGGAITLFYLAYKIRPNKN